MTSEFSGLEFIETDTETIINEMISDFEENYGRSLSAADPVMLLIKWFASLIVQERVLINYCANMNIPKYSKGVYLENLAEIFKDTRRKEAECATASFEFVLSQAQETNYTIPNGTRVSTSDDIVFETVEDVVIVAGQTKAIVSGRCSVAGIIGNNISTGKIFICLDDFENLESVSNVSISSGGCDAETDEELYVRMRENLETFSTAGTKSSYSYYVSNAHDAIIDVKPIYDETTDEVKIYVLTNTGELSDDIVEAIYNEFEEEECEVLGDNVKMLSPGVHNFNVDLTYYIAQEDIALSSTIIANVEAAVEEYVKWQTTKMGRDINPSKLEHLIMSAGVKRVEITSPVFERVEETSVATLNSQDVVNGGYEDE